VWFFHRSAASHYLQKEFERQHLVSLKLAFGIIVAVVSGVGVLVLLSLRQQVQSFDKNNGNFPPI
jgi:hypothetical protein